MRVYIDHRWYPIQYFLSKLKEILIRRKVFLFDIDQGNLYTDSLVHLL